MEPQADDQVIDTTIENPAGSEQAKKSLREALKKAKEMGHDKRAGMPTTFESAQARIERARDRIHDASSAILRKISSLGRKILNPIDEVKDIVEGLRDPDYRQEVLETAVTLMQEKALAAVDAVIIPELRMGIVNTAKNTAVVARAGLDFCLSMNDVAKRKALSGTETLGSLIKSSSEIPFIIASLLERVGSSIEGGAHSRHEALLRDEAVNRRAEALSQIANATRTQYGAGRLAEMAKKHGMNVVKRAKEALFPKQQEREFTEFDVELIDKFRDMLEEVRSSLTQETFDKLTPQQQLLIAFFAVRDGKILGQAVDNPLLDEMRGRLSESSLERKPKATSEQPQPAPETHQDGIIRESTPEELAALKAAGADYVIEQAQRASIGTGNAELSPDSHELPRAGEMVSITKTGIHGTSRLEVGTELKGTLRENIQIGSRIRIGRDFTTPVTHIYKTAAGGIFFRTDTSTYRLNRHEKDAPADMKEQTIASILADIESNIALQPQSVQELLKDKKEFFCRAVEIQGRKYLFTSVTGGIVIGLVQDKEDPRVWKTRGFRFSGSDHQWKSLPGFRMDNSYLKGDEENPLHHYVQSAKLHPDIYQALESLPRGVRGFNARKFLPRKASAYESDSHIEELEFAETYKSFQDPEWKSFQEWTQGFYKAYTYLIQGAYNRTDYGPNSTFYRAISTSSAPEMISLKDELDRVHNNAEALEIMKGKNMSALEKNPNPLIQKLCQVYKDSIGGYLERCFDGPPPLSMIPNFSSTNMIRAYDKTDLYNNTLVIHVEEYPVSSPAGDQIIFAMAYDSEGRVYIDNIYDPRTGCTDYGTSSEIVQMGHLVYKPEDYDMQTYGIPEQYLDTSHTDYGYVDISALWLRNPLIKRYKDSLIERGVLAPTNKEGSKADMLRMVANTSAQ